MEWRKPKKKCPKFCPKSSRRHQVIKSTNLNEQGWTALRLLTIYHYINRLEADVCMWPWYERDCLSSTTVIDRTVIHGCERTCNPVVYKLASSFEIVCCVENNITVAKWWVEEGGLSILQHEFQQKLILHVCTYFSTCYVQKGGGRSLACNKKLLFGKVVFIRDMVHPSLFQSSLPPTFHASFIQSFFHSSLPQTNQFGQRWTTLFCRCLVFVCAMAVHHAGKTLPEAPEFRWSLD